MSGSFTQEGLECPSFDVVEKKGPHHYNPHYKVHEIYDAKIIDALSPAERFYVLSLAHVNGSQFRHLKALGGTVDLGFGGALFVCRSQVVVNGESLFVSCQALGR
jgi:hypothetical protein